MLIIRLVLLYAYLTANVTFSLSSLRNLNENGLFGIFKTLFSGSKLWGSVDRRLSFLLFLNKRGIYLSIIIFFSNIYTLSNPIFYFKKEKYTNWILVNCFYSKLNHFFEKFCGYQAISIAVEIVFYQKKITNISAKQASLVLDLIQACINRWSVCAEAKPSMPAPDCSC